MATYPEDPKGTRTCPQCGEKIDAADYFCKYCGYILRTKDGS